MVGRGHPGDAIKARSRRGGANIKLARGDEADMSGTQITWGKAELNGPRQAEGEKK